MADGRCQAGNLNIYLSMNCIIPFFSATSVEKGESLKDYLLCINMFIIMKSLLL